MLRHFFLLFFLSFTWLGHSQAVDGVIGSGEYAFGASYDDGGFTLFWNAEGDTATFAVSAATRGWISLGLEPEDAMQGADMIFGWVTECYRAGLLRHRPLWTPPPGYHLGRKLRPAGRSGNGDGRPNRFRIHPQAEYRGPL